MDWEFRSNPNCISYVGDRVGTRLGQVLILGPVYTMDHEVRPWKMVFFHGLT